MAGQKPEQAPAGGALPEPEMPKIVQVSPGLTSKYAADVIPEERIDRITVGEAINYVVNEATLKPEYRRVADRVKQEMRKSYDVTIRNEKVQRNAPLKQFFLPGQTANGQEYGHVEIRVAATEEGGLEKAMR